MSIHKFKSSNASGEAINRIIFILLLAILSTAPLAAETLKVAIIRVAFQTDSSPATTGDGSFVLEDTLEIECSDWTLDPPPHGKTYFSDHLTGLDNYWERVSDGTVRIDLNNSHIFPANENDAYVLPNDMLFYHPYLENFDETAKLFELSQDALDLADPDVNFNEYSTVILVHAGMGGDFAFALDPTPGNIPSAYLSTPDFLQYGDLITDEGNLADLIIVPESQNFLQYKETRSLFADANDPCFYQVALNGTLALMFGFHLGLPPLYNTETGRSLVGGFALMDQGSNNFHGIVPAFPDPYSRIAAGWVSYVEKGIGDSVSLAVGDPPVRVSISDTEYYLIENRQRNLIHPDTSFMPLWIDEPGFDTVSVELSPGGVVLLVDEQDSGLPGNGLNIWHIDESAWNDAENPNGGSIQLVDYVEADGAQDMGYTTQLLFAEYLETGWWFDTWFAGNEGWFHLNRREPVVGDSLLNFSSTTFPSTYSNSGIPSHLKLENISKNGTSMTFNITSDRLVDIGEVASFIGWGTLDNQLWAFNSDSTQILECTLNRGSLVATQNLLADPAVIFDGSDYTFEFRDVLIAPLLSDGVRLHNMVTGSVVQHASLDSLFELSEYAGEYMFFAKRNSEYVHVNWRPSLGQTSITPLIDEPQARFLTTNGFQINYGPYTANGMPSGVRHQDDNNILDGIDVISWSEASSKIRIRHLNDDSDRFLNVGRPLHNIPLDVDDDGTYEIALFYPTSVLILNQAGIPSNGNPFPVEVFYGNPLIGPMVDGELGIFLRHQKSYSVFSLAGELIESGVLQDISLDRAVENTLRVQNGLSYILSANQLLYFEYDNLGNISFWSDPQGNAAGDRVSVMAGLPDESSAPLKTGSAYNYPNPVKGNETTIRVWLGAVDTWSVEIFSLSGAQVYYSEQAVSQQNTYNELIWDTSSISNGVFLAQIIAGNKAEIIKIAIIR